MPTRKGRLAFCPQAWTSLTAPVYHGGIWGAIGASAALALAAGLGRWDRTDYGLLGGVGAALAAVLVSEVIGFAAFPLDRTGRPIALTWATRLLARLLCAAFVASGAAWAIQGGQPRAPRRRGAAHVPSA